jgi:hypothetical protein
METLQANWADGMRRRMANGALGLKAPQEERRAPRLLSRIVWPEGQGPTAKATPPPAKAKQPRHSDATLRWMMDSVRARTPKGRTAAALYRMQVRVERDRQRAEFQALLARRTA